MKDQSLPATSWFMYEPSGHSVQKCAPSCHACEPGAHRVRLMPSQEEPIGHVVQVWVVLPSSSSTLSKYSPLREGQFK